MEVFGSYPNEGGNVCNIFVKKSWKLFTITNAIGLLKNEFDALRIAAINSGDTSFFLSEVESIDCQTEAYELNWDYSQLENIRCNTYLGHLDSVLWGESGEWGVFISNSEDTLVIAGVESFSLIFQENEKLSRGQE